MQTRLDQSQVIVVGGGAAGLMAAGRAAEAGATVTLLEKTPRLGQKIRVSGKTRCNLTNSAGLSDFIAMYGPNGRFLNGAFARFFRPELLDFLERFDVESKLERGGRIFPVSDDANDVVRAFELYLKQGGVRVMRSVAVTGLKARPDASLEVETSQGRFGAASVVLATGGASWPATGSTGDGYGLARRFGHSVVTPRGGLVPLITKESALAQSMQGVSLRNVRATAFAGEASTIDAGLIPSVDYGRGEKKKPRAPVIESRFGEMLFTHFGLGGPIILLMSLAVTDALASGPVSILIDLKPAILREQLRDRLQADFNTHGKKQVSGLLKDYLPAKMIDPIIALSGMAPDVRGHQIRAEEREKLIEGLKALRFNILSPLPLSRAIVTAGGVALEEIDPKTMASRKMPGLFICGELLDLDADTGGYNLQAAFSTGFVAGEAAAFYALSGDKSKTRLEA